MTDNENSSILLDTEVCKICKKISFCFLWVALYKAVYFSCVPQNTLILSFDSSVKQMLALHSTRYLKNLNY